MQIWACVTCKSYIFGWVGWDGAGCVLNHFIFVTEKSITFKKTKISQKDRKNLIYMYSHRYYMTYCLYEPRLLLSPSQPSFGLVPLHPLSPVWKRVRWVTRPNTGCERDYAYCRSSNREKIKIICQQLVMSKIWFHVILLWNAYLSYPDKSWPLLTRLLQRPQTIALTK